MTKKSKEQFPVLDLTKFIASILIVFLHSSALSTYGENTNWYTAELIPRLAVPFFFIISGFLFYKKLISNNYSIFLGTLKRIFYLYLAWSIIYLPIKVTVWKMDGYSNFAIFIKYVQSFIFSGGDSHLWYLTALIFSYIVIYFWLKKYKLNSLLIYSACFYIIGSLFQTYNSFLMQNEILNMLYNYYNSIFIQFRNGFFFGLFFVSLGVKMRDIFMNGDRRKIPNSILFLSFVVFVIEFIFITLCKSYENNYSDMRLSLMIITPLLFCKLLEIKDIKNRLDYVLLRNISTIVFTSHILIYMVLKQIIIRTIFTSLYSNSVIFFVIVSMVCIIFAIIIIKLSHTNKFKWMRIFY